jgi:DNA-binding transcriptional regulator YhcF (GntR family)
VYIVLFNAQQEGISKVSREYISTFLGIRPITVTKALADLEQEGLIRVLQADGSSKLKYNYEVLV